MGWQLAGRRAWPVHRRAEDAANPPDCSVGGGGQAQDARRLKLAWRSRTGNVPAASGRLEPASDPGSTVDRAADHAHDVSMPGRTGAAWASAHRALRRRQPGHEASPRCLSAHARTTSRDAKYRCHWIVVRRRTRAPDHLRPDRLSRVAPIREPEVELIDRRRLNLDRGPRVAGARAHDGPGIDEVRQHALRGINLIGCGVEIAGHKLRG